MAAGRCAKVAKLVKLAAAEPAASGHAGLQPSVQLCLGRLQQLQGGDVVDLTRSLARLRWSDEGTWRDIGSTVTQNVEEMKVAQLVQIAGAFSQATQPDAEMLKAMMGRVKADPSSLRCWSSADFIFSLQRAGVKPDKQLLKAAADAMVKDLDSLKKMKTFYIMGFVDVSLKAGFFHQGILSLLSEVMVDRLESLRPHDLSKIALTWGQTSCKDDALVKSLCTAIRSNLPSFPKNRISYTVHGLSMLDCTDKSLLVDLVSAWATTGPEESIDVVHIICGLARLGALDASLCDQIAACSLQSVPHLNARSIARILWACSQSGCTHVEFLESLGKAASQKAAEFSAMDFCDISYAGAKLSLAPILGSCIPEAIVERVSDFTSTQLACMMYTVSRLSDNPGKYLPVLERAILPHVSTLTPLDLRIYAWLGQRHVLRTVIWWMHSPRKQLRWLIAWTHPPSTALRGHTPKWRSPIWTFSNCWVCDVRLQSLPFQIASLRTPHLLLFVQGSTMSYLWPASPARPWSVWRRCIPSLVHAWHVPSSKLTWSHQKP